MEDFRRIASAPTKMAASAEQLVANIRHTRSLGLPPVETLPEFGKSKGMAPLAIVAGGPSLRRMFPQIRKHRNVMLCGTAHDYAIGRGLEPRYAVAVDADPVMADYVTKPCPTTTYLIATQCDRAMFDRLKDFPVATWHCAGGVEYKEFNGQLVVGGGITVTTRALTLAHVLGYTNLHFYGFDSCIAFRERNGKLIPGRTHAYPVHQTRPAQEIRIQTADGPRRFLCMPYHISQAVSFQDQLRHFGHLFHITVHGDGLIAAIMEQGLKEAEAMSEDEREARAAFRDGRTPDGKYVVPAAMVTEGATNPA